MLRVHLLVAVSVLTATTTLTNAQPADPKSTPLPMAELLPFLGDESFQKELKLTAAQLKKLLAYRQQIWDEAYKSTQNDYTVNAEDRNKATVALFKAPLDAEQFQRANELAVQQVWLEMFSDRPDFQNQKPVIDPRRIDGYTLRDYPALAEALKLSDDQKKLVAGPVILTPEQANIAGRLMGKLVEANWKPEYDPREHTPSWRFSGYPAPGALGMTASTDVQKEVKITDEQAKELAKLREQCWKRTDKLSDLIPADQKKLTEELIADTEKAMATILKPEQLTRLRQIALQAKQDPRFGDTDPLTSPVLRYAKELAVTPEQLKAFAEVRAKHAEAVSKAALSGNEYAIVRKAIQTANEACEKGFEAAVTPAQRAKLKEMLGEPFTGDTRLDRTTKEAILNRQLCEDAFGRYTDELMVLSLGKSIQAELKLTAAQIKASDDALHEVWNQFLERPPTPFAANGEYNPDKRSKFIEIAVAKILDKEQAKRFRQIMLQRLERRQADWFYIGSAVAYPGVAEAVKLTAEQKKKLLSDINPLDVLTDEQQKAVAAMLGEPFTDDYPDLHVPFGWHYESNPTETIRSARREFIIVGPWEPLQLTPKQVTELGAAINACRLTERFSEPPLKEDPEKRLDAQITVILTAEQHRRFGQLLLQSMAANDLGNALMRPEAAKLKLTPAQRTRMQMANEDLGRGAALVGRSHMLPEKRNEVLRELRELLDKRILATLTHEQTATWKELTGEPWDGFQKPQINLPWLFRFER